MRKELSIDAYHLHLVGAILTMELVLRSFKLVVMTAVEDEVLIWIYIFMLL